jgi:hypothetical protein
MGTSRINVQIPLAVTLFLRIGRIRVVLAYDGFVPILEQMAVSLVPTIEVDPIACENLPHALGKGLMPRPPILPSSLIE